MARTYRNEHASARIVSNPAWPAGALEVVGLTTERAFRGRGYAAAIMGSICEDADRSRTTLVLRAAPFGGTETDAGRLVGFYEGFGFRVIQDCGPDGMIMARQVFAGAVQTVSRLSAAVQVAAHG